MDNEYQNLENKFKSLSVETQRMLTSPEIAKNIREIGEAHDLKLDQISAIFEKTADVLLGTLPSAQFVQTIMREGNMEREVAQDIASSINTQVFDKIRLSIRAAAENVARTSPSDNSSLEKAGGFEIVEHGAPANEEEAAMNSNTRGFSAFSSGDKAGMVADIENPVPSERITEPKKNINLLDNSFKEPLVDQLLRGSSATPEQKVDVNIETEPEEKPVNPIPQTPQPPRNLPTDDPYREATK